MPSTFDYFYLAHINDTHSHFDETLLPLKLMTPEGMQEIRLACGGFSRLQTFIQQARQRAAQENREFLFLDAGDSFQGTLYYSCFEGKANAELLNRVGIDAMVVGNHELDTGNNALAHFARQVNFPLLAANWDLAGEPIEKTTRLQGLPNVVSYQNPAHPKPYLVRQMGNTPVAIFGLVLENMQDIAAPDLDSHFLPVVATARRVIAEIRREGIEHIVLLSHLGYDRDCQLAQEVSGLSMIIGGHTHTLQGDFSQLGLANQHPYGARVGQTIVLQAGYNALMAGLAQVELQKQGRMEILVGQNYLLTSDDARLLRQNGQPMSERRMQKCRAFIAAQSNIARVIPDADMDAFIEINYRNKLHQFSHDHVVSLPKGLRHIRIPDAIGGSQIAPLVAESMLFQARQLGVHIDVAIFNAGGARISLPPGPVTAAELAGRLLPFASTISYFAVKGAQLRLALEGAIINALEQGGTGSFPYPANLRYQYSEHFPRGQRIHTVEVKNVFGQWFVLDELADYRLITTSYTALGKEGYQALLEARSEPELLGPIISDVFINYARAKGVLLPQSEELFRLELKQLAS